MSDCALCDRGLPLSALGRKWKKNGIAGGRQEGKNKVINCELTMNSEMNSRDSHMNLK